MKTIIFKNMDNSVSDIMMPYLEDGSFMDSVMPFITKLGVDDGLLAVGELIWPLINIGSQESPLYVKNDNLTIHLVDVDEFPGGNWLTFDKTFRGAFKHLYGQSVSIDLPSAKAIAHDKRRTKRAALYLPYDSQVTSPNASVKAAANAAKQVIYDNDAAVQISIDAATTPDQLKQILSDYGAL